MNTTLIPLFLAYDKRSLIEDNNKQNYFIKCRFKQNHVSFTDH